MQSVDLGPGTHPAGPFAKQQHLNQLLQRLFYTSHQLHRQPPRRAEALQSSGRHLAGPQNQVRGRGWRRGVAAGCCHTAEEVAHGVSHHRACRSVGSEEAGLCVSSAFSALQRTQQEQEAHVGTQRRPTGTPAGTRRRRRRREDRGILQQQVRSF